MWIIKSVHVVCCESISKLIDYWFIIMCEVTVTPFMINEDLLKPKIVVCAKRLIGWN